MAANCVAGTIPRQDTSAGDSRGYFDVEAGQHVVARVLPAGQSVPQDAQLVGLETSFTSADGGRWANGTRLRGQRQVSSSAARASAIRRTPNGAISMVVFVGGWLRRGRPPRIVRKRLRPMRRAVRRLRPRAPPGGLVVARPLVGDRPQVSQQHDGISRADQSLCTGPSSHGTGVVPFQGRLRMAPAQPAGIRRAGRRSVHRRAAASRRVAASRCPRGGSRPRPAEYSEPGTPLSTETRAWYR